MIVTGEAIRHWVESELEQGQHIPYSEAVTVTAPSDAFLKFQNQRLADGEAGDEPGDRQPINSRSRNKLAIYR